MWIIYSKHSPRPEFVAEGFYSLITECSNGDALVVSKDSKFVVYPDISMPLILFLAAGSKVSIVLFLHLIVIPFLRYLDHKCSSPGSRLSMLFWFLSACTSWLGGCWLLYSDYLPVFFILS